MTYFEWLRNQVTYFDGPSYDYLLDELHQRRFIPRIERDENRAADGVALRDEYRYELGLFAETDDAFLVDSPCSILEFLVGMARRMNFVYARTDEDRTQDCFWMMMRNLGLETFTDDICDEFPENANNAIACAIHVINDRAFGKDGSNGPFLLNTPRTNQRNVEYWYQMQQYVGELMKAEGRI